MSAIHYLRDGYRWLVNPYGLLDDALTQRGLTYRIRLPVVGNVLMTGDERLIAEINKHPSLSGGKAVAALRAVLGSRSLIMLGGEAHAARRRLIAPLFRGDGLVDYDEITVRATREVFLEIPFRQTFSMYQILRRIGLKSIVAAMFGNIASLQVAETAVARFLQSFRSPLILFFRPLRIDAGPWSPWGRAVRNRRALCDFIRSEIQAQRATPCGGSILSKLVASADPGNVDDDDLIEEVLSLLLFGHDTAAATMAWAFAHIYADVRLFERIRDEADQADSDGLPDPAELPFLTACIRESMRSCPVVVHLSRTASADLRLGGHDVRCGQTVIPCTYLAHHNSAVFPDPYSFRPERFLSGQRYDHSYFPFGFGDRTCVGMPFAMRQMQLVLATAVRVVDMKLAPGYRPQPQRHLVLIVPRGGALMQRQSKTTRAMARSANVVPAAAQSDHRVTARGDSPRR